MKKLIILSLVIVLLAVSTLPALAKKETYNCGDAPTQPNKRYALAGRITITQDNDLDPDQVTVMVAVGNVLAEPCVGYEVVISVMEDTILKKSGGTLIDFAALKVGDKISSRGYIKNDNGTVVWEAVQITQGALLISK